MTTTLFVIAIICTILGLGLGFWFCLKRRAEVKKLEEKNKTLHECIDGLKWEVVGLRRGQEDALQFEKNLDLRAEVKKLEEKNKTLNRILADLDAHRQVALTG